MPSLLLKNLKINSRNWFGIALIVHSDRTDSRVSESGTGTPQMLKKLTVVVVSQVLKLFDGPIRILRQVFEPFLKEEKNSVNALPLLEMLGLFSDSKKRRAALNLKYIAPVSFRSKFVLSAKRLLKLVKLRSSYELQTPGSRL